MDGSGDGISPVAVTLQAAGACSLIDVIIGVKDREITQASVELNAVRAEEPPRVFTEIEMIYRISGVGLPEKLIERLIEQSHAKHCTVSNMLKSTAEITWRLEMGN